VEKKKKMDQPGKIHLIIGPMFSGKTTEMTRRINKYGFGNHKKKTIILKWGKDVRSCEDEGTMVSHDKIRTPCYRVSNNFLNEDLKVKMCLIKKVQKFDVIGIDEGHFFQGLVDFCETMCNLHNKIVIVTALDADFRREPFLGVLKLIPKCESVKKLKAICNDCSKSASFSYKTTPSKKIVEVGGGRKLYASV